MWVALLAAPLVAERCAQLAKQPAAAAQGLPAASDGADLNSAAAAAAASASDDEDDQEEQECCGETEGEEGPGSDAEAGSGGGALVAAAAPRRYRAVGALGPEQQARLDYLDAYGQVVSDVLDGMLQVGLGFVESGVVG